MPAHLKILRLDQPQAPGTRLVYGVDERTGRPNRMRIPLKEREVVRHVLRPHRRARWFVFEEHHVKHLLLSL